MTADPESHSEPETVLRADPVLAPVVDRHDLAALSTDVDEFERLCVSIVNQQLSTASARAVRERAFAVLDGDVRPPTVLAADRDALLAAGLSRTKVDYFRNVAEAFERRDLTRDGLADASNDEVIETLTAIRGVGEWTANMYLMFVLGRPDVLPLGDLAVRRGIEGLYNGGESMERAAMREVAEAWRPYRSTGTRYVWAEYEAED